MTTHAYYKGGCMSNYLDFESDLSDIDEMMTETLALQIIDNDDGDSGDEERLMQAWQYLLDTEAYLHLPAHYGRKIEELVEKGLID